MLGLFRNISPELPKPDKMINANILAWEICNFIASKDVSYKVAKEALKEAESTWLQYFKVKR